MKFIKLALILLFTNSILFSQTLIHPVNLNFEQAVEGTVPFGWEFLNMFDRLGYHAISTSKNPAEGKYCVELVSEYQNVRDIPNPKNQDLQAVLYQEIKADYFLGKEVYFAVKYKVTNPSNKNTALIFIQQEDNSKNFFRLQHSDTLFSNDWQIASISVPIDSAAKTIKFGMISFETADVLFDDAVFNLTYDFTKNHKPVNFTKEVHDNLIDLAKVYGTVKYFYPSPFLKNYPWEELLYNQIGKAVNLTSLDFLKQMKSTFSKLAPVHKIERVNEIKSASNYYYKGFPVKEATPFSMEKISDVFVSDKASPGTIINVVNLPRDGYDSISISVKYKLRPYSYNSKASLGVRFDNGDGGSVGEYASFVTEKSRNWETLTLSHFIPEDAISLRIALTLEGDGEINFDNVEAMLFKKNKSSQLTIRNNDFETPPVNNYISGWTFPDYSLNEGYFFMTSDDKFEGINSLKIFSDYNLLVKFPEIGQCFEDTLSDGSVFRTQINIPISKLKANNDFIPKEIPNFALNYNDSYSRFLITIELWNQIRHFSFKKIESENLKNSIYHSIYDANKAEELDSFEKVLENLSNITNDPNSRYWYGYDIQPYFPDLGIFVEKDEVYAVYSDSSGIISGSRIIAIDNIRIDSLIKTTIALNRNNTLNNKFLIEREVSKCFSGLINTNRKISFENNNKISIQEVALTELSMRTLLPQEFISEVAPGILYINSSRISDREINSLLPQLQNDMIKGFIIDLRGYSLLSEHILGLFTEKELIGFTSQIPVYTAPEKSIVSYPVQENNIQSVPKLSSKQIVFLINENSSSYSEIIAALARINKIGTVVGSPSQGNITDIEQIELPGYFFGSQSLLNVKLQGDENLLVNPIEPDVIIHQSLNGEINGIDEQLQKAIELIR